MLPGSLLPYYRALQVLQGMEGHLGLRVTEGWDLLPQDQSHWNQLPWTKHLCFAVTVQAGLGRTSLSTWS